MPAYHLGELNMFALEGSPLTSSVDLETFLSFFEGFIQFALYFRTNEFYVFGLVIFTFVLYLHLKNCLSESLVPVF